jgi:hypothetical protein
VGGEHSGKEPSRQLIRTSTFLFIDLNVSTGGRRLADIQKEKTFTALFDQKNWIFKFTFSAIDYLDLDATAIRIPET